MPYRVTEATIDQGSVTIEVDPVPSESKRFAPPNTGEEIERDKGSLPALGRCNDRFNLLGLIRHHVGIFGGPLAKTHSSAQAGRANSKLRTFAGTFRGSSQIWIK